MKGAIDTARTKSDPSEEDTLSSVSDSNEERSESQEDCTESQKDYLKSLPWTGI